MHTNISNYEKERCKLDIYIPRSIDGISSFPVIVYIHGGSLISGDKTEGWTNGTNYFGFQFLKAGVLVVAINYRLSGQQETKWPLYLEDAAASIAWVVNNIDKYGGDSNNIFVMGFSAGAYLAHMLGIDPRWYETINFDRHRIKGYIAISGQTRAHPTVAADLGIQQSDLMTFRPDSMPLGHAKMIDKPIHIFAGEQEGFTITDNYAYFNQLLNHGSKYVFIYTTPGKDHVNMRDSLGDNNSLTRIRILNFIQAFSNTGY